VPFAAQGHGPGVPQERELVGQRLEVSHLGADLPEQGGAARGPAFEVLSDDVERPAQLPPHRGHEFGLVPFAATGPLSLPQDEHPAAAHPAGEGDPIGRRRTAQ
jgi:hypothetical protein